MTDGPEPGSSYGPFALVSRAPLVLVSRKRRLPAWLLLLIELLGYVGVPLGVAGLLGTFAGCTALILFPIVPMVFRMALSLHSSHDQLVTRVKHLDVRPREHEAYRSSAGLLLVVDDRRLDADEVQRVVVTKNDERKHEGDEESEMIEVFKLYLVLRQLVFRLYESTRLEPMLQLAALLREKLLRSTAAVEVVQEQEPVDFQQLAPLFLALIPTTLGFAGLAATLDTMVFEDQGLGPLLVLGCGMGLLLVVRVVALLYARRRRKAVARFLAANFWSNDAGAGPQG
jgi:hypothetical protein